VTTLKDATKSRDTSNMTLLKGGSAAPIARPALPQSADPEWSPLSLAPIPPSLGTETDASRSFYRQGVSQLRMLPLPAQASPSIGAQAASQAKIIVEPVAVVATAAQTTANTALAQVQAQNFQGAWNSAVPYSVGATVDSGGSIYLCIVANINESPASSPTYWSLLSGSTSFQGAWSSATSYTTGELVTASGNLYIALQSSTNKNPTSTVGYWQILTSSSYYYGVWSSTVNYPVGAQVSYQGNFYVATTANTNQTPSTTSSFWTLLGTSAILIGTWSSSTAYVAGNEVSYAPSGGATNYYVALQASTNQAPGAATNVYWYLIANNTAINSASSYRPTTNPLSATDAGSSATITIASFTMNVAGVGAVSVSGGTLTGLSYGTVYYVYYADPSIAGGAVTFQESTTKTGAISSGVDFFVGSILTPLATAPNTIGFNDGGTGAQTGVAANLFAALVNPTLNSAYWTNLGNANDGDLTTFATGAATGGSGGSTTFISGFSGVAPKYTSLTLNIKTQVTAVTSGSVTLSYSLNSGLTWTTVYLTTTTRALTTDSISLPITQNIGAVQVEIDPFSGSAGQSATVHFYEAWIVAVS
jgi:hypothetical protein